MAPLECSDLERSVSDMKPRTGCPRQIVEGSVPTQGVLPQVATVLTKGSPSRQVVGVVPFDDVEQVLEWCCVFPFSHPDAQHDWLVEHVELLWASEDVGCGFLQVEGDACVLGSTTSRWAVFFIMMSWKYSSDH